MQTGFIINAKIWASSDMKKALIETGMPVAFAGNTGFSGELGGKSLFMRSYSETASAVMIELTAAPGITMK